MLVVLRENAEEVTQYINNTDFFDMDTNLYNGMSRIYL